jgi:hypothetical protein
MWSLIIAGSFNSARTAAANAHVRARSNGDIFMANCEGPEVKMHAMANAIRGFAEEALAGLRTRRRPTNVLAQT